MKYLHKYVPTGQNDDPYPILIHGDQLSVERMIEAKLSMAFSEDQADQLTGLVPRPQGFHKRYSLPEDEDEKQKMFEDICRSVVKLVKPQFDVASIQQAAAGDHENVQNLDYDDDDSQSLDDTILYWNDGTNEFEDTLPYYEDSEDEFELSEEENQNNGDSVFAYSCCMVWRGLLHMIQREAERSNNGEQLLSDWRLDMVEFWNRNHNKYLILGHRLLAGINGWLPARLRQEVEWNSTANLLGKPGHNVALDLVNEFLNNEFKANLKNSHGQYTEENVSRCSKIVGSVGKAIEKIFEADFVKDYIPHTSASDGSSKAKLKKFIEEYGMEELFVNKGNERHKHHTGFNEFKHEFAVKDPEKLYSRFCKYGKALKNEEYIYA
uniref:Uncharacterized protein LOC111105128 n=1 Tax=Crassostrea virginica TaxID=6565 RepID=A0A8B8AXI6_CRAVI|nr:uncharacterized protein LOC111105128 [Crassostrea virginica]